MLPAEVTWVICEKARSTAADLKSELGDSRYEAVKDGLKAFLCDYFSAVTACDSKQGKSISPIKSGIADAKGLKVRLDGQVIGIRTDHACSLPPELLDSAGR